MHIQLNDNGLAMIKITHYASLLLLCGCATVSNQEFAGSYIYGHEVSVFQPCNSIEQFWLTGEPALMQTIKQQSLQLATSKQAPYQAIYIKFSGFIDQRKSEGFATDYQGKLYMEQLLAYSQQIPADCSDKTN